MVPDGLEPEALPSLPLVAVSARERAAEALSVENLTRARAALASQGFVVLENAVDPHVLDTLRAKMTRDSEWLLRAARFAPMLFWSAAGKRVGHLQQSVPRNAPYVFRDVVCNPLANQVLASVMGDDAFFVFSTYNCNVNCPGSVDQDVHFDPAPPGTYVVNIALSDTSERNGAIELWPGSHLESTNVTPIPERDKSRRAASSGPIRCASRKGSLLIRDLRLWHRGRANPSAELRHMLAVLYYSAAAPEHPMFWAQQPTTFDRETAHEFRDSPVRPHVEFRDGPIHYILEGPRDEMRSLVTRYRWSGRALRVTERLARRLRRA